MQEKKNSYKTKRDYEKRNVKKECCDFYEEESIIPHILNKKESSKNEKKEEVIFCNNVKFDDCVCSGNYVPLEMILTK